MPGSTEIDTQQLTIPLQLSGPQRVSSQGCWKWAFTYMYELPRRQFSFQRLEGYIVRREVELKAPRSSASSKDALKMCTPARSRS